jgi:hypothetical protein
MPHVVTRRLVLVVGSQCEALDQLSFLPDGAGPHDLGSLPPPKRLVGDLHHLLVEGPGGCRPVHVRGESQPGLLLNPTHEVAEAALVAAIAQAHEQEAVLVLCFVGHGSRFQSDPAAPAQHLLHVWDTVADPKDSEPESKGWDLYATVSRRRPHAPNMVGIILLVDSCYASWAKQQVDAWSGVRGGLLAAWLGSSGDHEAWDACFTKTLITVLSDGLEAKEHPRKVLVPDLLTVDLEPTLGARCPVQSPRLGGYENHNPVLFLGRNVRVTALGSELGLDPATETTLLRLTDHYVTFAVEQVVDAVNRHRITAIVGDTGTGKSTLAAALRHPPPDADDVPLAVVHALAFMHAGSALTDLASTLRTQLERLPAFGDCLKRARREDPELWSGSDPWRQLAAGLRHYPDPVRILLDGLDQFDEAATSEVLRSRIVEFINDPGLGHVKLILSGRAVPAIDGVGVVLQMPDVDHEAGRHYLRKRGISEDDMQLALDIAAGNWLFLELVADAFLSPEFSAAEDLFGVYDAMIDSVRPRAGADVVLAVLAAAGTGAVLPFELLHGAMARLDHPLTRAELHELLGDRILVRLVDRARPGQPSERLGLFHQTLTEHVSRAAEQAGQLTSRRVHAAIADAIAVLAPDTSHTPGGYRSDPLLSYAFTNGPRHLHLAGRTEQISVEIEARQDPVPSVNLIRARAWAEPIEAAVGRDHRASLSTRGNMAAFTGRAGDAAEAVRLFDELLPDITRNLGPDDRDTLAVRAGVAYWTGRSGHPKRALRAFQGLLVDRERALGPDDPDTLSTRGNIGSLTGQTGNGHEAVRIFSDLLRDLVRIRGTDHPSTLAARHGLAYWTGWAGRVTESLRLFGVLLPDRERVLGADHPETFATRSGMADMVGANGNPIEALSLYRELLRDQERVLGQNHRLTLNTRSSIAKWTSTTESTSEALRLFRSLLPDRERVLGPQHPDTLTTRFNIATLTAKEGDTVGALALFRALLPDRVERLGLEHPDTRATQDAISRLERQRP